MAISFEEFAKVGLERGFSREEITSAYEKEFNVKFQPTPKQEDVDTLLPPDESKEVKPPIVIGGQLISKPQQYPSITTPMLRPLDEVQSAINPDSLEMAEAGGESKDNYLASVAVSKFFSDRTGIAPQDVLRVGRATFDLPEGSHKDIYDQLNSLLNHPTYLNGDQEIGYHEYLSLQQEIAKQQLGQKATTIYPAPSFTLQQRPPTKEESLSRFDGLMERAKWRQYDIPDTVAKQLEVLYKNDAIDTAIYYGGMAPRSLTKAVGNFVVNIGDKVNIPTPWTEGLIEDMTSFEREYMNDYFLAGQINPFLWAKHTQGVTDLAGNIWLMAQGVKSFSAATGKQFSFLKMPATTAAEYQKGIFGRSLFLATAGALNTPDGFEKTTVGGVPVYVPTDEQMNTFGLILSYANTGIVSSRAPAQALTYLTDLAMNASITATWSTEEQQYKAGGQYADAFETGAMYADELGLTKPEVSLEESLKNLFGQYGTSIQRQAQRDVARYAERFMIQMSQTIPIATADAFFSAMVRSTSGSGQRAFFEAQSKPIQFFRETDKVDKGASARYVETLRSAYGDLWRDSMTRGEGIKLSNIMFMEQGIYAKPVDPAIKSRYPVLKAYQPATGSLRDVKSNNPVTINNLPPKGTAEQNEKLLEKINVRVRRDNKLQLTHFSPKEGLEVIDPELAGTGPLMGRERFRGGVNKSYFGIEGYNKESGLGDNRYITSVELDKLYPAYDNPLNFPRGDISEYETAIKDAGFQGYIVEGDPRFGPAVIMFDSLPVESSFKDNVTVATSGNFTSTKLDDFVATNIEEVKALPLSVEGGETYNLDGTRYNDGGVTIPFASFKVNNESMISKDNLTADNVLKFIQSNDGAIVSDLVKAGIYKPETTEGEQKYSIDLNIVVPKQYKDLGVRFAKKAGQKSLYDLDKNEEILTGEDGTNVRDFSVDELKTIQTSLSKGKMPPVFVEEIKPSSMQIKAEQISKAMENLERIMRSDKRTEVITTDAELKEFAPDKGKTKAKKGDIIPRKPKVSQVVTEYAELKKSLQYLAASSKKSAKTIKEETKVAEKIKADIRVEKQKDRLDALKIKQRKLKEQQKKKEKARKEETQRIKVEAKDRAMNIVKGLTTNTQIIREYEKQSKAIGTSDKKFLKFINKAYTEIPKLLDQQVREQASAIITKNVPNIDFEYRKAADEIKSSISMNTSDKMIARYEASLRYMEEHPDAQLPQSYIKKLRKTPVQNLSTKDLVAFANEKERLIQLGKTKLRLRNKEFNNQVNERLLEIKENYEFLSETIRGANPSDPFVKEFFTFEESIVKGTKVRKPTLKLEAIRPQRFFDMLDGGRAKFDGPMYNTFVVEPNRAYADMVEMRSARYESYNLLLQDLNESSKTLGAPVTIDGIKYERRELAGAYAISKNRIGRAALINGNFKNISDAESHLAKILNHVETDIHLKQIAEYFLYDFQYNQGRVEKTLGLTENKILTIEENYFSLERRDVPMESSKDFMDMLVKTSDYTEKLPNDKFVLDRKENDGFQSPVNLNIDYVWTRQTAMQEHYIAHAGLAKSLNKIKSDRVLRGTIESEFGDKALRYLDRQVELINNPNSVYKAQSDLELISRQLRGNFAGSALGLNFKTILKQMPSVNYYLGETTPAHLIAAIDQATLAFRKDGSNAVLDFVAKKDPIILESVISRELIEMKKTSPDKYNRYINKIGELGFKGIVEVDRFVRSTGWMAVYNKKIEDGFSEQAAIDAARNATLRTQPTARAADLPLMYTTDEFLNWSLMFSNQLNQMWNMQTYDIPRRLGNVSTFIPAIQQQTGLALSAMTMWQINNGRVLPDEKEDLLKEVFADQFFAQIPLIGGPILQGYKGYSFDQPIVSTFEDAGKIMFKLVDGQEVTSEEYFNAFLFGVAPFTGLPTVFGRRAYNVIMESSGVLEGIKEITGIKEPKK